MVGLEYPPPVRVVWKNCCMVQVQDNKKDVGTIKQINKTYKHSMREVTETDLPSLLFILVYLVFLFRSMFYVLDFKLLIYVSFASNDQTFP